MLIGGIILVFGNLLASVCGIIALIGAIIAFIGFYKIYTDKEYFPEPHPSNMKLSLGLYILGFILVFIGIIFIVASAFGMAGELLSTSPDYEAAWDGFISDTLAGMVFAAIGSFFWFIARYKLLVELIPFERKSLLNAAIVVSIALMFIGMIISVQMINNMRDDMDGMNEYASFAEEEDELDEFTARMEESSSENTGLQWGSRGLSLIGEILFLLCIYYTWDHHKKNPQLRSPYPGQSSGGYPPYPPPPYSSPHTPHPSPRRSGDTAYGYPPPPAYDQYNEDPYKKNLYGYSEKLKY
jgi:hypothetical protein